ncbi:methyltransferase, FxLD system [Streptomonospora algeriensis]|uniref:Protein-L-isoaspartate O-methyltransferase n=1 Tax=Streptomonospora algeriensis TaxID=995084 RepID=A0ABW3BAU3_9ACTN
MTTHRTNSPGFDDATAESNRAPEALRSSMVEGIAARHEQLGRAMPTAVEAALRTVPRHVFAPGVELEAAYADDSLVTKKNERGVNISSVSAPTIIAGMLGQLDVQPGHRVLEIGSGGYNAALLAELVGPDGAVTTMDIDPEVVDRARTCLDRAGYDHVRTLRADGEFGAAEFSPFDRIIATVGAWDIPPAWREQIVDGGRMVAPLRTKGLTRSWALQRCGDHLVSRSHLMCGFVPMQGAGEHRGRAVPLYGDDREQVGLWVDEDQPIDAAALASAMAGPRAETWSGVVVDKGEFFADQDLWLVTLPEFCVLTAQQEAIDQGVVSPSWRLGTPALVEGGTVAYRARLRPADPETGQGPYEFGAYAHGPDAPELADRLAEQIRIWDRDHRAGPEPVLNVFPAGTPDAELPQGCVLDKRHSRIVLSWSEYTE